MHKISIIITCYNCEQYLENAINSVLRQTIAPYEIVIVDDKSTDNSKAIIEKYSNSLNVISNPQNMGIGYSKYIGAKNSTGDYILFLDADDILSETLIKEYMPYIDMGYDLIGSSVYANPSDKKQTWENIMCCYNSLMFTRNIFNKCSYSQLRYSEDLDVLPRLLYCAQRPYFIQKKLYIYQPRANSCTKTASLDKRLVYQVLRTINNHFFFLDKDETRYTKSDIIACNKMLNEKIQHPEDFKEEISYINNILNII